MSSVIVPLIDKRAFLYASYTNLDYFQMGLKRCFCNMAVFSTVMSGRACVESSIHWLR